MDIYKVVVFNRYKKYIKGIGYSPGRYWGPIIPLVKLCKVENEYKWVFIDSCQLSRSLSYEVNKKQARLFAKKHNCSILYKPFKLINKKELNYECPLFSYKEGDLWKS